MKMAKAIRQQAVTAERVAGLQSPGRNHEEE